jgi:hypothetical protein
VKHLLLALGAGAVLDATHRLALHAESRRWIFYRACPLRVGTLGLLEELVDPGAEYMVEEQVSHAIRAERSEQGEGYRDDDEPE